MSVVARLVTFVDLDNQVADDQTSVSARHEVELADGSRVLLLDDRGWGGSGPPDIWARTSVESIVATTRMVVGPDEPFGDRSQQDMEADHWARLQQIAQQQGVVSDAAELRQLPHDVVLSPRLLAHLRGAPFGKSTRGAASAPGGGAENAVHLDSAGRVVRPCRRPEPGHS